MTTNDAAQPTEGELVIVTGMTGAGRSTAAKELEDLGFFVVDNLPTELVHEVVRLVNERHGRQQAIAAVVDVRAGEFFRGLTRALGEGTLGRRATLVFLEADDGILVRRQEAARRPHPLQKSDRLLDGIRRERVVLEPLRGEAQLVIDTTALNPNQLRARLAEAFGSPESTALQVTVLSFGFKYGVPVDADLMADMRFLPNPHWVPELREQNGRDAAVAEYVLGQPAAEEFLERYLAVIDTVAGGYRNEGKRFMTVGIGCTGGKHRSVAMVEETVWRLVERGYDARARHRDLGRE